MRGPDTTQAAQFSDLSPEARVPATHPLRPIRPYVETALTALSPQLDQLYAHTGRLSIALEKRLRALLLQVLDSLRSERLLMEELQYNLLVRWVVGLDLDAPVWDVTVFTKNRDRLLEGAVATAFFEQVWARKARQRPPPRAVSTRGGAAPPTEEAFPGHLTESETHPTHSNGVFPQTAKAWFQGPASEGG